MMTNNLNAGLIKAVEMKLPKGTNVANALMDTLFLGREAIYRRMRNEVPFTLAEATEISRKLGISLDKMIGMNFTDNVVFNLNVVNPENPYDTYYDIIKGYADMFATVGEDPETTMATSSNIIPQALYMKHGLLARFRLFKWMYQNDNIKRQHFDELVIPQKLLDVQKMFVERTQQIQITDYIWDSTIFEHLINDVQYFSDLHLLTDEDKRQIKQELFGVADELEEMACKGRYENGNDVRVYLSNINFEATYSYMTTSTRHVCMIRVYSINSITTQDDLMFHIMKEWIHSLKKFSTQISESGEMQRTLFFKQQREIIDTL